MILTIKQDDEYYQLKAPVFNLETQRLGMTVSGQSITFCDLPENTEENPTATQDFLNEPENGMLVLGSTTTVVENQATTNLVIEGNIPEILRRITTINNVSPNDQGEFFIDGSECDSWGYTENSYKIIDPDDATKNIPIYVDPDAEHPVLVAGGSATGIWITDLCPACTSCETIYRLKYEVENLKLWLNTLKDVSLYWSNIYDIRTDYVAQRRKLLSDLRITGSTISPICSKDLTEDDRYMQLKGIQLLQQYMTVVHMWNYVVSRNNSSTLITIAPEDTTGFVVQTKRALPSCDGSQSIKCVIDVCPQKAIYDDSSYKEGYPDKYPISVYVPADGKSNEIRFEPFMQDKEGIDNQSLALGDLRSLTISTLNDAPYNQTVAHKRADTTPDSFIPAKVAGTYVITVKFLPFIYYRAWRGRNPDGSKHYITMRGGKQEPDIQPYPVGDTGAVIYNFGLSGCDIGSLAAPTAEDYLDAKTAPTCSVNFKILWKITITWTVNDTNGTHTEVEDYTYLANGIRTYFDAIMSNTEVLPLEPEEPTSSGAQT